jgi:hypothetical protein
MNGADFFSVKGALLLLLAFLKSHSKWNGLIVTMPEVHMKDNAMHLFSIKYMQPIWPAFKKINPFFSIRNKHL